MSEALKKWVGTIVLPDGLIDEGAIITADEEIVWVGPEPEAPEQWQQLDPQNQRAKSDDETVYLAPGLVDVHCHGGGGASFPDALTIDDVKQAAGEHLRNGTTTLVASLVTAPLDVLETRASLLADAVEMGIIEGIHFEGPFVSEARCGAQDPRYIIQATPEAMRRLVTAARGKAVSMTIAPEQISGTDPKADIWPDAEAQETLRIMLEGNILPSWGHTDASLPQTEVAFDAGFQEMENDLCGVRGGRATVTHLFNGMRPLHHREPGPIPVFLSHAKEGTLVLEMINDGTHLDPDLVADVVSIVGRDNAVFVTDAMAAAGMEDGSYVLGPQAVTVKDGVARLTEGGAIAGGTARLLDCVRTAYFNDPEYGQPLSISDAFYLGSTQGAKILGLEDRGMINVGKRADILVLDGDLQVRQVVRGGQIVAGEAGE